MASNLVDELILYVAPCLLGDQAPGIAHLPDIRALAQKHALRIEELRAIGDDWRIIARPAS